MSVIKIKEREDLKARETQLSNKVLAIIKDKKREMIDSAVDDFINFFKNNGFTITGTNPKIAKYQTAEFSLQIPDDNTAIIGSIGYFKIITKPDSSIYTFKIIKKDQSEFARSSFVVMETSQTTDEITREIERIKNNIGSIEKQLENKDSFNYTYHYAKEIKDKAGYNKFSQIDQNEKVISGIDGSFSAILKTLFE